MSKVRYVVCGLSTDRRDDDYGAYLTCGTSRDTPFIHQTHRPWALARPPLPPHPHGAQPPPSLPRPTHRARPNGMPCTPHSIAPSFSLSSAAPDCDFQRTHKRTHARPPRELAPLRLDPTAPRHSHFRRGTRSRSRHGTRSHPTQLTEDDTPPIYT